MRGDGSVASQYFRSERRADLQHRAARVANLDDQMLIGTRIRSHVVADRLGQCREGFAVGGIDVKEIVSLFVDSE